MGIDQQFADHWIKQGEQGHEFLAELMGAAREGHLCLVADEDPSLPVRLVYEGEEVYPQQPIVRWGNAYYLQRHWAAESEVINALQGFSTAPKIPLSLDPQDVTDEQRAVILHVAAHRLTLLTGGPGTGKTYTASQLIREVLRVDPSHRIALAAPTGKAVANLGKALGPPAKTLHSLLMRKRGKLRAEEELFADLIIVDEASMIDVGMMATLLTAIPAGARLVLMGDGDQLPPVEAGGLFADMVGCMGAASLTRCLRVETESLVDIAKSVKEGKADLTPYPLTKEELIGRLASRFPSPFVKEINSDLLEAFMRFRLLAPLRKGPFGVDGLNALFHSHFQQKRRPGQTMVTPIMISKNAHPLSLYNGEVGLLVEADEEDYALFPNQKVPRYALPPYEIAYCLSVHKSQGSEFEEVAFVLSPGADGFGRELFYTALTRAKRSFELFGSHDLLQQMVGKKRTRLSGLQARL